MIGKFQESYKYIQLANDLPADDNLIKQFEHGLKPIKTNDNDEKLTIAISNKINKCVIQMC